MQELRRHIILEIWHIILEIWSTESIEYIAEKMRLKVKKTCNMGTENRMNEKREE